MAVHQHYPLVDLLRIYLRLQRCEQSQLLLAQIAVPSQWEQAKICPLLLSSLVTRTLV